MFGHKLTHVSNCHPFEVVGYASETHFQMGENLKKITYREHG